MEKSIEKREKRRYERLTPLEECGYHRKVDPKEVVSLLESGMRPIDVAQRLGISRERVRQIDFKFTGKTGKDRAGDREETWSGPPDTPFVRACEERGLAVFGDGRRNRTVLVNGWRCRMRFTKRERGPYYRVGATRDSAYRRSIDFFVFECDRGFLIFPRDKMPSGGTMFSLDELQLPGGHHHRHDWKEYLNAWHFLEA